jgi:hypothetical protein
VLRFLELATGPDKILSDRCRVETYSPLMLTAA